jgi:hypothetical protein
VDHHDKVEETSGIVEKEKEKDEEPESTNSEEGTTSISMHFC